MLHSSNSLAGAKMQHTFEPDMQRPQRQPSACAPESSEQFAHKEPNLRSVQRRPSETHSLIRQNGVLGGPPLRMTFPFLGPGKSTCAGSSRTRPHHSQRPRPPLGQDRVIHRDPDLSQDKTAS
eukprot:1159833-Pelagomonas_calceolata.AAC.6